jgi:hypothetical protein
MPVFQRNSRAAEKRAQFYLSEWLLIRQALWNIFLIHWLRAKLVVVKKILAAFHASTTSFLLL